TTTFATSASSAGTTTTNGPTCRCGFRCCLWRHHCPATSGQQANWGIRRSSAELRPADREPLFARTGARADRQRPDRHDPEVARSFTPAEDFLVLLTLGLQPVMLSPLVP